MIHALFLLSILQEKQKAIKFGQKFSEHSFTNVNLRERVHGIGGGGVVSDFQESTPGLSGKLQTKNHC